MNRVCTCMLFPLLSTVISQSRYLNIGDLIGWILSETFTSYDVNSLLIEKLVKFLCSLGKGKANVNISCISSRS